MSQTPLVDVAWLAGALGAPGLVVPGLVVLDATYYLPNEGKDPEALFTASHIPGARFFSIDGIADPDTDLPHMVPSPFRFAKLVGALGVSRDSHVVVYDQKGVFSAPRAWWMFGLFGHDRVSVLDGGLPAWLAAGQPVDAGAAPANGAVFVPDFRASWLRGLGDITENLARGTELVVDARPAGRFDGSVPEPRPGLPNGHMPGAVNLPAGSLVVDGHLLPPASLRARFTAAGVDGTRPVITSCGSGVSAAVLTLALRRAGLPQGALYDGSWTEYASRPDTPKVTSG